MERERAEGRATRHHWIRSWREESVMIALVLLILLHSICNRRFDSQPWTTLGLSAQPLSRPSSRNQVSIYHSTSDRKSLHSMASALSTTAPSVYVFFHLAQHFTVYVFRTTEVLFQSLSITSVNQPRSHLPKMHFANCVLRVIQTFSSSSMRWRRIRLYIS